MTFEKKFSTLKTKFAKADTKKLPERFAIQLTMTDDDCGGTFYIANIDGTFSVEPYDYVDNNAAVTGTAASIAKLASGTVDSLEIFGDESVVEALAGAYKTAAKKPCAKKTCAKKPAVKKPAQKKTTEVKAEKTVETKPVEKKPCAKKPCAKKPAVKTAETKTAAKPAKASK